MSEKEIIAEAKKIYFRSQYMQFLREARGITEDDLKKLVKKMKELILSSKEKNPYTLFFNVLTKCEEIWPTHTSMPLHGEWHHILVPGVVLTAMRNSHYPISDREIMEGIERGEMGKVSCGFSGTCGAANGVGIVAAIVKKSTPHHDEERQEIMRLVANSQQEISQIMRRCCKRSTYIGIKIALNYLTQLGYNLQGEEIICPYSSKNSRCAGEQCPYHPRS